MITISINDFRSKVLEDIYKSVQEMGGKLECGFSYLGDKWKQWAVLKDEDLEWTLLVSSEDFDGQEFNDIDGRREFKQYFVMEIYARPDELRLLGYCQEDEENTWIKEYDLATDELYKLLEKIDKGDFGVK